MLGRYKLLFLVSILVVMPVTEFLAQGKGGRLPSFIGLLVGLIAGVALGYMLGPIITETISGPVPAEYNIRTDLVLWWALSASIFASCFCAIGGWLGRKRYAVRY